MSECNPTDIDLQNEVAEARRLPNQFKSCRYNTLDREKKQIRLLLLLPGEFKDPICCNLLIAHLDEKPYYKALSYVWGDPIKRLPIFVNGQEHHITTNLYRALRRLRDGIDVHVLWIDALCINQNDISERSHQVTLMKDIYSLTEEAILFIGDHKSDDSDPTYTKSRENQKAEDYDLKYWLYGTLFIRRLQSELGVLGEDIENILEPKEVHDAFTLAYELASSALRSILKGEGIPRAFTNEAAKALLKVLRLPWFTRIWTVQEAVIPRESIVVCGSIKLQWVTMMEASRLAKFWKLEKFQFSSDQTQALEELEKKVLPLRNEHESFQDQYGSEHYHLLQRYQHREATDPRDKVFALLSMTYGLTVGALIEPDYAQDVGSIYTTMCRRIIESGQSLEALAQRYVHDRKDLPSWVSDWSYTTDAFSTTLGEWNYSSYLWSKASGSTKAEIHTSPNEILSLSGFRVDEVSAVGPKIGTSMDSGEREWKSEWEDIILHHQKMDDPYIGGGTVRAAFHRTLTKNRWCIVEPETGAFIDFCTSDLSYSATSGTKEKTKSDYLLELDIQGQRPFTTRKGYLGIGSSKIQVGDLVCVLLGGKVPFILRHIDQTVCQLEYVSLSCSFVGQAYVHGIMRGEAIRERTDKMIFSLH